MSLCRYDVNKPCENHGTSDRTCLDCVLDEIRAEIMKLDDINPDYPMDRTIHISRNEVLQIIDKYRESEGKE